MELCVCATDSNLDSPVSPTFARCPYFLIVNSESKEFRTVPNPAAVTGRGAGVAASQLVVSQKAEAVICGNFGPNAFSILQMSGIKIYPGVYGLTIKEAIDKYNQGELKEMKAPSFPEFGPPGRGRGRGFGPGFGPGFGRRGR